MVTPSVRLPLPPRIRVSYNGRMTLAAGFMASDGILLCADTLVTDGYTKQHKGKIWTWQTPDHGISVAFAVAGDATIGVMAAENCVIGLEALKWDQQSFADVYGVFASTVRYIHQEYVDKAPVEDRERSRFWMLIAIYTENSNHRLYVTNNAAIAPVSEFDCIGSGRSIGIYILEPSYRKTMSVNDISVLALHAFAGAKERCDGVGGIVHFLAVRKHAISPVGSLNIQAREQDVLEYRQRCAELLSDIGNPNLDAAKFEERLTAFAEDVRMRRACWNNQGFDYLLKLLSQIAPAAKPNPQLPTADPSLQPPSLE